MILKATKWSKFSYLRSKCLHFHNTDTGYHCYQFNIYHMKIRLSKFIIFIIHIIYIRLIKQLYKLLISTYLLYKVSIYYVNITFVKIYLNKSFS